ncbi:NYN domain-containing protein [Candidatus Dependentiae bacterium]|nr:NYN domain-containing protein [Candidatus Dependentiae bacterium]
MIIIIDGYNLLKQVMPGEVIGDHERERFIQQLCEYARKKKHSVVLVFDGGSYVRPTKEIKGNVQIVYSGHHESADDYIHRYVEKHKSYDMLLISSDRELRRKVAACAAVEAIHPEEFYRLFLQELRRTPEQARESRKSKLLKTSQEENTEVDALMAEFSALKPMQKGEDGIHDLREKKLHQKSKKERKLLTKIKKL